jgi:group I intron endonuclease
MQISGLYIVTNKINGNYYIGSSNNIMLRWTHHKYYSLRGSTKLPKFYNALRKYGIDNFDMKPLLYCSPNDLYFYEQRWLNANFTDRLYNVSKHADSPMRGASFSSEHRNKLKKARQGRIFSIQTREKMSNSRMGRRQTPETIAAIKRNRGTKCNWDMVRSIRTEYNKTEVTQRYLSAKYNISTTTINNIIYNRTWKEI